ncbi:hypothetical protein Ancab_035981 [Ancistrocladus abbreviatus]
MWSFASNVFTRSVKLKNELLNPRQDPLQCSDDEASDDASTEERLECPVCWESFNLVENVPYALWCGHTLCKQCVLGLPWAALKFPSLPVNLPFFISCPWCNLLCFRLFYKGTLRFPRKNYFLLWMVESMNGERARSYRPCYSECRQVASLDRSTEVARQVGVTSRREPPVSGEPEQLDSNHLASPVSRLFNMHGFNLSLRKSWTFFVHLTAKLPLVIIFLLIILYAIPASAAILALYILITIIFALPSFLVLYFAYPSLDWLIREIVA